MESDVTDIKTVGTAGEIDEQEASECVRFSYSSRIDDSDSDAVKGTAGLGAGHHTLEGGCAYAHAPAGYGEKNDEYGFAQKKNPDFPEEKRGTRICERLSVASLPCPRGSPNAKNSGRSSGSRYSDSRVFPALKASDFLREPTRLQRRARDGFSPSSLLAAEVGFQPPPEF